MTIKKILLEWLKYWLADHGDTVKSHDIERHLPNWGNLTYNVWHSPSSYARRWREIKSEASLHNLRIVEVTEQGDKESSWEITYLSTPSAPSQDVAIQVHQQS